MVTMIKKAMANKKAIFKTLEAFIAAFITLVFLIVFIPQIREKSETQTQQNVLATLRDNDEFRNCVIQKNETCINQTIDNALLDTYYFKFNLSEDPNAVVSGLPEKRVYANSMFMAGNTTNYTQTVVRLYYWTKT